MKGPIYAQIRREEESEKAENCREDLWNEIQLKGPERQKQTQEQNKKKRASSVAPPREGEPAGTAGREEDDPIRPIRKAILGRTA